MLCQTSIRKMQTDNIKSLFKYKSLRTMQDLIHFLDIIENDRLYAPTLLEVNDPFEACNIDFIPQVAGGGMHSGSGQFHPIVREFWEHKRIVSLSSDCRSPMMWAHYADNYKGVCIQLLNRGEKELLQVGYLPKEFVAKKYREDGDIDALKKEIVEYALTHKYDGWSYEKEWRIIKTSEERFHYLKRLEIKSVILGESFSKNCPIVKKRVLNCLRKKKIRIRDTYITHARYKMEFIDHNKVIEVGDGSSRECFYHKDI